MTFDEVTDHGLSPYLENEAPTCEWVLTKSDCIAEAHDRARVGSHEAEGFWLLMAVNLDGGNRCRSLDELAYAAPETWTAGEMAMVRSMR